MRKDPVNINVKLSGHVVAALWAAVSYYGMRRALANLQYARK